MRFVEAANVENVVTSTTAVSAVRPMRKGGCHGPQGGVESELPTGRDAKLIEDLAQMPFNRAWANKQLKSRSPS